MFVELGSATLSSASPADEITFAVVEACTSSSTPGVNAPNWAGGAERQRQRGRHGAADGAGRARSSPNACDLTAEMLPLKSVAIHFSVVPGRSSSGSGSARARGGFHSVDAVVGVEPSIV